MPVILVEDVDNLGNKLDIVQVAAGYARNYLIPRRLAIEASERNLKWREQMLAKIEAKRQKELKKAEELKEILKGKVITIPVKVGSNNKIFGSVNSLLLAQALKEQTGFDVDRRNIEILEEVKTPGTYSARIKLKPDVVINFTFEVVPEA
ncbi:MAG: 50S ribosomal protein L9 [Chlorobi bacterium]|nr:50S ribosomal protein L9 [Chlorobiota bacterium]